MNSDNSAKVSPLSILLLPRVTLAAESGRRLNGTVVQVYNREGYATTEAPTIRNLAGALFAAEPEAERVAVISTDGGQILLILEAGHRWFDVKGCPVQVRKSGQE